MKPTALFVNQASSCIPLLDASGKVKLKEELPADTARVADADKDFDPSSSGSSMPPYCPTGQRLTGRKLSPRLYTLNLPSCYS